MVKGGLLRDDTEWAKAGIKPGQKLMMMGTADVVPTAPTGNQACPAAGACIILTLKLSRPECTSGNIFGSLQQDLWDYQLNTNSLSHPSSRSNSSNRQDSMLAKLI